jgi:hypothetical protein
MTLMFVRVSHLISTALLVLLMVANVQADPISEVRTIFNRYSEQEAAFDAAIADLYADSAIIKNRRSYPDGSVRELTMPAPRYKQMVRSVMPLAKARGDYNTYSGVTFHQEGAAVRVTALRYSMLKKYTSPLSLLFVRSSAGAWLIQEELSESRP